MSEKYLTMRQVAARVGCTVANVNYAARTGALETETRFGVRVASLVEVEKWRAAVKIGRPQAKGDEK